MNRKDSSRFSYALRYALGMVEKMEDKELVMAPSIPTAAMIDAGAKAGKVSGRTAAVVYRAMIRLYQ